MDFKIEELQLEDDSPLEQQRVRKIFEVLKTKAIRQDVLTEYEKDFFCSLVMISRLDDGVLDDYACCDNYKFKHIYLTYFKDLTGGIPYYKLKGTNICKVELIEAQADLQYLYEESDKWKSTIQKSNHKTELLQQISSETRNELKKFSNLPEVINGFWRKGSFLYLFKERSILLESKFNYCIALEIFATLKPSDLILEINSTQIEFNEYSLIHVLNRHYSQIRKQYSTGKTFHNKDFKPRILGAQLKEIVKSIDNSNLLQSKNIDKIRFQKNGVDYLIWTSEKTKSVKGRGNIIYRRVDTFYPVAEKDKLITSCDLQKIDDTLSVYVPK